jgi:hypothetical protein
MTKLNEDERDLLRWLVDSMIPADEACSMPSAADPAIFPAILMAIEAQPISLTALLSQASLVRGAGGCCDRLVQDLKGRHGAEFSALLTALAHGYYRDDRVMRALGMEPRPPFPKGLDLAPGDWSVLEPVQQRAPIWRS